jgi:hypothetical protein
MDNFNQNVFKQGHFKSWNDNFGKNFTDNFSDVHKQAMIEKNIETGGAYQAAVSGAYGEFTIAAVFKSLTDEYHVMNDILLQQGVMLRPYTEKSIIKYGNSPFKVVKKKGKYYELIKKSTQIDHVIVSPYGIFVIETKNHKGWVFGDANGRVWTQVLGGENGWRAYGGHSHFTFYNPVTQNQGHIEEMSKQLKMPMNYMTGMIVFTNPEAYLGNVNCTCCYTIDMLYEAILSYQQPLWNMKQTEKVIKAIEGIDTNNYTNAKEHEMYVKDIKHRHEINRMIAMNK